MSEFSGLLESKIDGLVVRLIEKDGALEICPETESCDMLQTLAAIGLSCVSDFSLEVAMRYGHRCIHLQDALKAYAIMPGRVLSLEYRQMLQGVDWSEPMQLKNHLAIALAGSSEHDDVLLLRRILECAMLDFRDGPICAASASSDIAVLRKIADIATNTTSGDLGATGEKHAILFCFRRWLHRGLISQEALTDLLRKSQRATQNCLRPEWFMENL